MTLVRLIHIRFPYADDEFMALIGRSFTRKGKSFSDEVATNGVSELTIDFFSVLAHSCVPVHIKSIEILCMAGCCDCGGDCGCEMVGPFSLFKPGVLFKNPLGG